MLIVPKYQLASFYQFTPHSMCGAKAGIESFLADQNIKGSVILAKQGINASLCGDPLAIKACLEFVRTHFNLDNLILNVSDCEVIAFKKLKVKIKAELITFGAENLGISGRYVEPKDWNQLIAQEDVVVLDTRNNFEYEQGNFQAAINPKTAQFSQFSSFVKTKLNCHTKKIAMYCTGGIRCEIASKYMSQAGYKQIYQLQGGIVNYLQTPNIDHSAWQGQCFVFDERLCLC